jgi:hypothetical protein
VRVRLALIAAGLLVAAPVAAGSCEPPNGFTARGRLQAGDVVLLFRTVPAMIEVGQHFSVDALVCAPSPAQGLRVDAQMPEHRHGMNYRPRVAAKGGGRYLAEGLLLHMPGRWQLLFEVERGGRTERLVSDLLLE